MMPRPARGAIRLAPDQAAPSGSSTDALIALAALLALLLAGTLLWKLRVTGTRPAAVGAESWEQVKEAYPALEEAQPPEPLSREVIDAVVEANPFAPQRRQAPAAPGLDEPPSGTPEGAPTGPRFQYRGRVNLGTRQRAILEDRASKKTAFVEVGQEVAGFKVLDIQESQVVLSDPKTNEAVVVPRTSTASP